jgi:two-component system sensor kinase FixL
MSMTSPHNQLKLYLAVTTIWLILLIALASTIVAFDIHRAKAHFFEEAQLRYQQANDRVQIIESVLEGFAAMISVTNDLRRERIRRYAHEMLEQYPFIFMFEIVDKVSHDKLQAFIDYYRKNYYPDFEVKGFRYETDRQWQPIRDTPYHLPIVFMEPFPEESRKVLGLDVSSNVFFMKSLRQSELQNRSIASDPFTLVEGNLAYVLHRPIPAVDKTVQSHLTKSNAEMEFALLVIRADTLIDSEPTPEPGSLEILFNNSFDQSDPRGYLHQQKTTPVSWLESHIFPHLQAHLTLNAPSQPFVLVREQQLGWHIISWGKLGFALLAALFTFAVMLIYARLYLRDQIAVVQRYLQISKAMIVGLDCDGNVNLINRRGCEILGYDENELLGRHWFKTVVPENIRDDVYNDFRRIVSGEIEPLRWYENTVQTKSGTIRYIDWNNDIEKNHKGRIVGTLSSGQDITEHKLAEANALRQQREIAHTMRLSTMGEMATAIAHELNQPLSAIAHYCEAAGTLVKSAPDSPQMLSEIVENALSQAHRAGDIIRHIREFVGNNDQALEIFELDSVIVDAIKLLKWEIQEYGVAVQFNPGGQKSKVNANKIQIEQVVINLLQNSLQAIGKNNPQGKIIIKTRLVDSHRIEVTVTDNGPGVPSALADTIFLQFQTSKKEGMGIGLSLSRTIIEAHGGTLWLDKEFKDGASFGFVLPTVD